MKQFFLLIATATLLFSCKKDNDNSGYYKGDDVAVHHGKSWSWLKTDADGKPQQLGIALDAAAMNSVPNTGEHGHGHENHLAIPLHTKAIESTPYKFIMLNWNPDGHEPEQIYGLPHFDFHFYMNPVEEVMTMVDMQKMDIVPAADYFPPTYFTTPGGVPTMGKHWIDATSPELAGQVFTETFLFGSYNGQVTFYEPMITWNFLNTTTSYERNIPQPAKFQKSGYYPTKMRIAKQGGTVNVILDGFTYRQAS